MTAFDKVNSNPESNDNHTRYMSLPRTGMSLYACREWKFMPKFEKVMITLQVFFENSLKQLKT